MSMMDEFKNNVNRIRQSGENLGNMKVFMSMKDTTSTMRVEIQFQTKEQYQIMKNFVLQGVKNIQIFLHSENDMGCFISNP